MKPANALRLICILLVTVLIALIAGRSSFLQWVFKHEQARFKKTYHLNIAATQIKFVSWNRIQVSNLVVKPDNSDTLAVIKNLEIRPSFTRLLLGKISFNEIKIDSAVITAYNLPGRSNLMFLKNGGAIVKDKTSSGTTLYQQVEGLKERLFKMLNTSFEVKELKFSYNDTSFREQINIPSLNYDLHRLTGLIINQHLDDTLTIHADVKERGRSFNITLQHNGTGLCYLPFLDKEHGFKCKFQSVLAEIKLDDGGGELQLAPVITVSQFHINHWRLAKEDVVFPQAQFKGLIKINEQGIELDSASTITLNHAVFKCYTAYQTLPDTVFALNIHMPETVSDTFFNALPGGMFNTLKGISCSGTLAYDLRFKINTRQPDSLIFDSQLKRKNFRIICMGVENYTRIADAFIYDAFSGDQFIRHIMVGPDNPGFTPLGSITPRLQETIWQSEDPSFMMHHGFVPESFRESIVENYKQHRFARGGSTITMQLVKNVFLNRNKTISRKAEEALIVYLIENLDLISKGRMMEIYLNVIEWGPNIYGVSEAAKFYFNKKPSELNLQECIFLAAIIPNPRYFRYQFNKQGEIKPYMADFFKIIAGRLVLRGYISSADTIHFMPHVKLSGPALQMIVPADSVAPVMDETSPDME